MGLRAGLAFVNAKVFRLKKARHTQGLREKSHHQLAPAGKVGVPELRRFHGTGNPPAVLLLPSHTPTLTPNPPSQPCGTLV